jgi:tRNA (uracil-5-)-methyltransferase
MTATQAARRRVGVAASADGGASGADEAPAGATGRRKWRKAPPQAAPPPDSSALNIAVRPESYDAELEAKVAAVQAAFAAAALPLPPRSRIAVFASERAAFRQRAEFDMYGCRSPEERGFFAMNVRDATGRRVPVEVTSFPFGSARINALMPALLAGLAARDATLRRAVFQCNFLTTRAGGAVVTLIYRRALDAATWLPDAEALRKELGLDGLVGRSRGVKLVAGSEAVEEELDVGGKRLKYRQMEDTFSQSNAGVAENMLRWAADAAGAHPDSKDAQAPRKDDLLELYCGCASHRAYACCLACIALTMRVSIAGAATLRLRLRRASAACLPRR